ncbi:MAG: 4-hydroxybenzoate decarboxylase [Candidatus Methanoperedens nitroreducens]|uniref:Anhydromevalonate phosphate decarboxylase n=1 Tax=Candidatus Methanoperedens nitratireducens TaxID=1392998 RepID=A0A0P8ABA4_9EURY|nr:UbiD family decarboxylase [Candidatus Methanoperedens sp. BLZ2]KAB2946038.1 MAG: UbiD family decarboxylase [Candidatus Methanoperedens sp.]KPQ43915.1 MAG: 4-hydroxybenzoate decarboxylase [Candidatus Methanoperedens sp. BLZ1]MBZ0175274.1 UbiD family decarboxylase [Candidatus Methanoperedens nitroreducens]MCX9076548.1 UbiD family decarboxylase [Candidatus Methanoperedens sp.]
MTFRGFIEQLRSEGKLTEIKKPLSPVYEVSAIAGKEPTLYTNVNRSKLIMNILSSRELLAEALGVAPDKIIEHLSSCPPDGEVKLVRDSPAREVIEKPDLYRLPILTHFEGDGAPYITAGVVVSEYEGLMNASIHRLRVIGKDRLAARLVEFRHTYNLHKKAAEKGEPLPIAIVIGIDPVTLFAISTRVPEGKEYNYAAALAGEPLEVTELENGIKVPHAEIVLEGYIHPTELVDEGPFVDISGTYDIVRKQPVIYITKILHRRDPIYHALLPAGSEHHILMGIPYEPLIFNEVKKVADVRNVIMTPGGCYYFHAAVQIHKTNDDEPKKAIDATFAAHKSLKHVIIVDDDINIFDPNDIEFAIATRVKGDEDIYIYPNVRGSTLDPRSENGIGTKVGIDATMDLSKKWKFERAKRPRVKKDD